MAADLQAALEPPTTGEALAKALNSLVAVPLSDIQPSARTAVQFARLLNEARILLERVTRGESIQGSFESFERRCRKQLGPIIEVKP